MGFCPRASESVKDVYIVLIWNEVKVGHVTTDNILDAFRNELTVVSLSLFRRTG